MFFLAMFFDIQFPNDDGTCATYTNQNTCLSKKGFTGKPFCSWEPTSSTTSGSDTSTSGNGTCDYATPEFDFQILLLIAWFQLILSAPIEAFVE